MIKSLSVIHALIFTLARFSGSLFAQNPPISRGSSLIAEGFSYSSFETGLCHIVSDVVGFVGEISYSHKCLK